MIKTIVKPFGFVMGLAISIIPLWMILGKDFGDFRLVLVAKNPETATLDVPDKVPPEVN